MITFSIVIPVYNAEKTISRALDSCINQIYLPKEIILIDDGSSDSTMEFLLNWRKNYKGIVDIVIEQLEINSGPSIARNRGWNLAKGQYVCFLDADDWFLLQKLEVLKEVIKDKKGIMLLSHAFSIGTYVFSENSANMRKITSLNILMKNIFATPTVIIKKDIVERFDEKMHFTEDHDLFLRVTEKYQSSYYLDMILTCIDRPINSRGGQSENIWEMRKGEIKMYKKYCIRNRNIFLFPLLVVFSLGKHIFKIMKGNHAN